MYTIEYKSTWLIPPQHLHVDLEREDGEEEFKDILPIPITLIIFYINVRDFVKRVKYLLVLPLECNEEGL